jgi:DNA-binding NtrC family response regulator
MQGNLLVVNEKYNGSSLETYFLNHYKDSVFIANSFQDGLKILDEQTIYCVASDLTQADVSGCELIKFLRGHGNNLPFVFFTDGVIEEVAQHLLFDNALILRKPSHELISYTLNKMLELGFEQEKDSSL